MFVGVCCISVAWEITKIIGSSSECGIFSTSLSLRTVKKRNGGGDWSQQKSCLKRPNNNLPSVVILFQVSMLVCDFL